MLAELETQIAATPTDDDVYVIYGDLLQLEGDPRGELIAIDAAYLRDRDRVLWERRRRELLQQHPALVPPPSPDLHLSWHLGFIRRVLVGAEAGRPGMFDHPSLRFVTELVFLAPHEDGFEERCRLVCRQAPHLRSLALGDPDEPSFGPRARRPIELPALVDALPVLEQLHACEQVELGVVPQLRRLSLAGHAGLFPQLARTPLPALEALALRGLTHVPLDQLGWLLEQPPSSLVELELVGADANDLIPALVRSPVLKQLRRLRLWNASLTTATARKITSAAFGHLELLDLSDPLLDDEAIALVASVCPEVRTISPWMRAILKRPG